MTLTVKSPAFAEGGAIPPRYTCDGDNVSPALSWFGQPVGTKSFVLIMDDPDAPSGTFTHWVLFDVPAPQHELAEGHRAGISGLAGTNDFSETGYGGPCPPKGHGVHRYYFMLSALDCSTLGLLGGASRRDVETRMRGHVLATAKYMGKYERKR